MVRRRYGRFDTSEAEANRLNKRILVENKKYAGKFVAMKSFTNRTIISSGTTPREVIKRAKEKGVKNPLIHYVPEKNRINIY